MDNLDLTSILTSPEGKIQMRPLNPSMDGYALFEILHRAAKERKDLYQYMPFVPQPTAENYIELLDSIHGEGKSQYLYCIELNAAFTDSVAPGTKDTGFVVIGLLGFLNIRNEHKSVELGHIFIDPRYQGRRFGLEASKILIRHCIEKGDFYRLEWKTHHLNFPSQKLAEKLGFVYEGVNRNHLFMKGAHRHSFYYSLIPSDYPRILKLYNEKNPNPSPVKTLIRAARPKEERDLLVNLGKSTGIFKTPEEVEELLGGTLDGLSQGELGPGHQAHVITNPEGEVMGWCYFGPEEEEGQWNLWWIGVHPSFHRNGYGKVLLRFVESTIRSSTVVGGGRPTLKIETSSGASFKGTRKFYLAEGYREAEEREAEVYGEGEDKVVYSKVL